MIWKQQKEMTVALTAQPGRRLIMGNAHSTWPANRDLWVMVPTPARCQIDGRRELGGAQLLPSPWGLSLTGDAGVRGEDTDPNAGAGSHCFQGLTREMTLGILEMLRPVGTTSGPT